MAVTAEVKDRVAAAGVVVGVVRSASEKFFSAGADVKGFLARSAGENLAMVRRAHQVFDRFAAEAPLFIAAIAGHALGGGYELALACDVRIAAGGGYRIGLPEVTLGLLPGTGGTQRLPRLIGRGRALELLTSGRTVAPAEAERLGMVDRLVPASEFDTVVADLAAGLAAGAPLAVAAITRVVNDGLERSLADGLDRELEELASLFATEDAREASPPPPRSGAHGSPGAEVATRQVGDETLSPRAYDVTMRWALERTEARVRQRVAGAAGPDEMLDAVFVDPELIEGTFLTWLQRDDWRTSHPEFKARCHESLRALLGAGR